MSDDTNEPTIEAMPEVTLPEGVTVPPDAVWWKNTAESGDEDAGPEGPTEGVPPPEGLPEATTSAEPTSSPEAISRAEHDHIIKEALTGALAEAKSYFGAIIVQLKDRGEQVTQALNAETSRAAALQSQLMAEREGNQKRVEAVQEENAKLRGLLQNASASQHPVTIFLAHRGTRKLLAGVPEQLAKPLTLALAQILGPGLAGKGRGMIAATHTQKLTDTGGLSPQDILCSYEIGT